MSDDANKFYSEGGEPLKCRNCGCEQITQMVTDSLDVGCSTGLTLEFKCVCNQCLDVIGYWAHGSYDPSFIE
jgi:hypothetical protein